MYAGLFYFVFAAVAIVSAKRAGSRGGGKQRAGMIAAAAGFTMLGVEYYVPPADVPNQPMLSLAGVLLVVGVILYWWGHLKA